MDDHVDKNSAGQQNEAQPSRARVRESSTVAPAGATESQLAVASAAELEAIATAVEQSAGRPNDTIRDIIARFPEVRRLLVGSAIRALGATRWRYCNTTKKHIVEPDFSLAFRAAEFLADRVDGRPPQSVMNLNVNANAQPEKKELSEEMLMKSPAMLEAMERMIARVKAKQAGVRAQISAS